MSDPVTIATIALSAVNTIGQARAARADASAAAGRSEADAAAARARAAVEATERRREASARAAALRARFGAAGLRVEGTPVEVLGQTLTEGEHDARLAEWEGELSARDAGAAAATARARGRARMRSGYLTAGASLLRGSGL